MTTLADKMNVQQPIIKVDYRESPSGVPAHLERINCKVELIELQVGDYIIADDVGCERKTPEDLITCVTGTRDGSREKGHLFKQIKDLTKFYNINEGKQAYLLIEGTLGDLFGHPGIPANAPFGWLEAVMTMGCAVRFTASPEGTAHTLKAMAVKAQSEPFARWFQHHGYKQKLTHQERAERMLEYLPGVGSVKAHELYEHFGSVEAVTQAKIKELVAVEGIGHEIAWAIRESVTQERKVPMFL